MDARQMKRRPRVIRLEWTLPHYRAGILRRLSQNQSIEFTACTGDNTRIERGGKVTAATETGDLQGIRWRRLASHRVRGPLFRDYEWQPDAVKIALREELDAVIMLGHPRSFSNWLVRVICRLRRIPIVDWTIGARKAQRGLKWTIQKLYARFASAHLLYGQFGRDFYLAEGFPAESLFVVRNSMDYDRQVELRDRLTPEALQEVRRRFNVTGAEQRLVFHSGRLMERKRLDLLIAALAGLRERGRRVTCVLIGEGPSEPALRRLVEEHRLTERVVFFGPCFDEEKLAPIFAASDLCVSPGATGLLVMHSFVYGTPILVPTNGDSYHGPEVEAITEGRTGGFFRRGDAADLSAKMEAMLFPEPCKPHMAAGCRETIAESFTPEYQEQVILRALNYVWAKAAPGP